jgi:ABC-2 type transport system ATP-binding protein
MEAIAPSFLLIYGGRLLASGKSGEIESLLASTPQEVVLVGKDASKLVPRLVDQPWTQSLRLTDGRTELRVAVRDPGSLYQMLPRWISEDRLQIDRFQTADGNLTALFDSLLRHHRGEHR